MHRNKARAQPLFRVIKRFLLASYLASLCRLYTIHIHTQWPEAYIYSKEGTWIWFPLTYTLPDTTTVSVLFHLSLLLYVFFRDGKSNHNMNEAASANRAHKTTEGRERKRERGGLYFSSLELQSKPVSFAHQMLYHHTTQRELYVYIFLGSARAA